MLNTHNYNKRNMPEKIAIRNCTFAFRCEAEWEQLEKLEWDSIRFCNACQKEVYFCYDDYELISNIHLNRCVAFARETVIEMGYFNPEKIK
jgi:hypothetical protein